MLNINMQEEVMSIPDPVCSKTKNPASLQEGRTIGFTTKPLILISHHSRYYYSIVKLIRIKTGKMLQVACGCPQQPLVL